MDGHCVGFIHRGILSTRFFLGTPALTTRGLTEEDFVTVADFIDEGVKLAVKINQEVLPRGKKVQQFKDYVAQGGATLELKALEDKVTSFMRQFPTIGFEVEDMKYQA